MEWDLNIQSARDAIAQHRAKKVLIQLPDGIKPHAQTIVDELRDTGAELFIWTDSNYGACDLPVEARNVGIDLILHFGHEAWNYGKPAVANATLVSRPENPQ
jgi:2-(3-amino-3-carboxypropyl)histidine synthase